MTSSLDGSVLSYGMSFIPSESQRALDVASSLAGRPADIKRVGPVSLDLCKVADGTYDAYFEPMLHVWDIAGIAAGTVVVWEAQGTLSRWDGERIHWRHDNDVVASSGTHPHPRTAALPAAVSVARLHQPAIIFLTPPAPLG